MAEPAYVQLRTTQELALRAQAARRLLARCELCPHRCGVDRTAGASGRCGATRLSRVASYGPHFGEERVLVGDHGSGAIFFSGCNLRCVYCQNADISQSPAGRSLSPEELAGLMLDLAQRGCHNINLVSPTHVVAQIVEALHIAAGRGLQRPMVYNCGGYESVETLKMLDGIVDIYLPDAKYWGDGIAKRLSACSGYPEALKAALREMHRQVGPLVIEDGLAVRGLLVRHLVLPGGLAGTLKMMTFIAEELSRDTYVNIMGQYRPTHKASEFAELNRLVSSEEVSKALQSARKAGLHRFAE